VVRDLELIVNGEIAPVRAQETATLLDVLRNQLGLTGPRFGCGAGECMSCAVLVDGVVKASCQVEVGLVDGKSVTTVEGLGDPERPHPLQVAFLEKQAGQCGYCLSGILIGAKALLDANPDPSRAEIAAALDPHLCRCGAHNRIMDAVALAAARLRGAAA
jgi:nicotinate dehydrogenase subunit A